MSTLRTLQSAVKKLVIDAFPDFFRVELAYPEGFPQEWMVKYPKSLNVDEGCYLVERTSDKATVKKIQDVLKAQLSIANRLAEKARIFEPLNRLNSFKLTQLKFNTVETWDRLLIFINDQLITNEEKAIQREILRKNDELVQRELKEVCKNDLLNLLDDYYYMDVTRSLKGKYLGLYHYVRTSDYTDKVSGFYKNLEKGLQDYSHRMHIGFATDEFPQAILIYKSTKLVGEFFGKYAVKVMNPYTKKYEAFAEKLTWEETLEFLAESLKKLFPSFSSFNYCPGIFLTECRPGKEFAMAEKIRNFDNNFDYSVSY